MNNEEIERKMNFIVEQQAQFASDIQQLQESQTRTEQVVAHTAEAVTQTAVVVGQMGEVVTRLANVTHIGFNEVNAKLNALVDSQIRTEENIARTDDNLRQLVSVASFWARQKREIAVHSILLSNKRCVNRRSVELSIIDRPNRSAPRQGCDVYSQ